MSTHVQKILYKQPGSGLPELPAGPISLLMKFFIGIDALPAESLPRVIYHILKLFQLHLTNLFDELLYAQYACTPVSAA
jgi:hypothetical protein